MATCGAQTGAARTRRPSELEAGQTSSLLGGADAARCQRCGRSSRWGWLLSTWVWSGADPAEEVPAGAALEVDHIDDDCGVMTPATKQFPLQADCPHGTRGRSALWGSLERSEGDRSLRRAEW